MDAKQIINQINSIYDRFEVPPNLRMHMIRAAALAEFVCDNWKGPKISKEDIIAVSLIHDLGNIVKFDMETPIGLKLLGDQIKDLDKLRKIRDKVKTKYGIDDHDATQNMAKELGINDRLMFILKNGGHAFKDPKLLESNDWDIKIHAYTDFRVGPFGIMPIKDRFEEFRRRQKTRAEMGHKNVSYLNLDKIIEAANQLEKDICVYTDLSPQQLNDNAIQPYLERYTK